MHRKLVIITLLTLVLAGLTSYFLKTDRVYTHIFYIPIAVCAANYPKYTIRMGLFLSLCHVLFELVLRGSFGGIGIVRIVIIMSVTLLLKSTWSKEKNYIQKITQLDHESNHDCMTEVLNRRGLELLMQEKRIKFPAVLIMSDLDGLKAINDRFGHATGDMYIKAAATILRTTGRQGDIICRIGGDEFLMVLQRCQTDVAVQIIKRIEMSQQFYNTNEEAIQEGRLPSVSISLGYAVANNEAEWESSLKAADDAMYQNKLTHYKEKEQKEYEKNHSSFMV